MKDSKQEYNLQYKTRIVINNTNAKTNKRMNQIFIFILLVTFVELFKYD